MEKENREEVLLQKNINKLLLGDKKLASRPLIVSRTPNILVVCGAEEGLDFTISKSVIDKCLRPENRDIKGRIVGKTGHGLSEKQVCDSLLSVKNPVMVLRGNRDNSLVVVTGLTDDKSRPIFVTVELNKRSGRTEIHNVTSIYGRDRFQEYLELQNNAGNILAVDNKKAESLLRPIGKWYPKRGRTISFDTSIAYTMRNVKYPHEYKFIEERRVEHMPQMKFNDKVINVTDTGLEEETSWGEIRKLFADTAFYEENAANYYTQDGDGVNTLYPLGKYENPDEAEDAFYDFLRDYEQAAKEPAEWEMLATRVQEHLQEYGKSGMDLSSTSRIAEALEFDYSHVFEHQLENYAESLASSAAEIEKYNAVMHTLEQIKNLPLATKLQQHLHARDNRFFESAVAISENLANGNIDDYVKKFDSFYSQTNAKDITSLEVEFKEAFNDYLNKFSDGEGEIPNDLKFDSSKADFDELRGFVDGVINEIGAEDSEYVTDELMSAADALRSKIDQLEIMDSMRQLKSISSQDYERTVKEHAELEMLATRVQEHLQEYGKSGMDLSSTSKIAEALVDYSHVFEHQLENYAESLASSAAEIEKYNAVIHTLEQIKNLPLMHERSQDITKPESEIVIDAYVYGTDDHGYVSFELDIDHNEVTATKYNHDLISLAQEKISFADNKDFAVEMAKFSPLAFMEKHLENPAFDGIKTLSWVDAEQFMLDVSDSKSVREAAGKSDSLEQQSGKYDVIFKDDDGQVVTLDSIDTIDDFSERLAPATGTFEIQEAGKLVVKGDIDDNMRDIIAEAISEDTDGISLDEERESLELNRPVSEQEIAHEISEILYAHSDKDISLDEIEADILSQIETAQGNPDRLDSLIDRLDKIYENDHPAQEESAKIYTCVERLNSIKGEMQTTEQDREIESREREQPATTENSFQSVGDILKAGLPQEEADIEISKLLKAQGKADDFIQSVQLMSHCEPDIAMQMADASLVVTQAEVQQKGFPQQNDLVTKQQNPLNKVEEMEEGNYNQIDGIINNLPPKADKTPNLRESVEQKKEFVKEHSQSEHEQKEQTTEKTSKKHTQEL